MSSVPAPPPGPVTGPAVGDPVLNVVVFAAFLLVVLVVVLRVARSGATRSSYYAGGHGFTGPENGLALSGDFLSAATFLGIVGAVAVSGPDGFGYAVAAFVAWLLALFFVAEFIRNTGRYTLADVLTVRLRERPVRAAAATSAVVISTLYLLAQLAGAGGLVALLLDVTDRAGQAVVIAGVGGLMLVYVLIGGMTGTTWLQIAKAALLVATGAVMAAYVLGITGLSLPKLFESAALRHPEGDAVLRPGLLYGGGALAQADLASLALGGVLGVAGLPHILMRFYTVPTARQARSSVTWAIWLIGGFFLLTLVIGYGAAAMVGPERILAAPGGVNSAAPLLALEIGGEIGLALVSAIAFATILAVVAGLTITAAAAFAHDVYANLIRRGTATAGEEIRVARRATLVIGVLGTAGGILANGQNIAFLVSLTFTAAASANLPTLLYSLFWRGFTTSGALWSMYGGLAVTVGLIVVSPAVSGAPTSMLPELDFAVFPLTNPGLVSVPAGFLLGFLGSVLGRERPDRAAFARMSVRALTGAGVEHPVHGDPTMPPPAGRHRRSPFPGPGTRRPAGSGGPERAVGRPAAGSPADDSPTGRIADGPLVGPGGPAPHRVAPGGQRGGGTGAFFQPVTPPGRGHRPEAQRRGGGPTGPPPP